MLVFHHNRTPTYNTYNDSFATSISYYIISQPDDVTFNLMPFQ